MSGTAKWRENWKGKRSEAGEPWWPWWGRFGYNRTGGHGEEHAVAEKGLTDVGRAERETGLMVPGFWWGDDQWLTHLGTRYFLGVSLGPQVDRNSRCWISGWVRIMQWKIPLLPSQWLKTAEVYYSCQVQSSVLVGKKGAVMGEGPRLLPLVAVIESGTSESSAGSSILG